MPVSSNGRLPTRSMSHIENQSHDHIHRPNARLLYNFTFYLLYPIFSNHISFFLYHFVHTLNLLLYFYTYTYNHLSPNLTHYLILYFSLHIDHDDSPWISCIFLSLSPLILTYTLFPYLNSHTFLIILYFLLLYHPSPIIIPFTTSIPIIHLLPLYFFLSLSSLYSTIIPTFISYLTYIKPRSLALYIS